MKNFITYCKLLFSLTLILSFFTNNGFSDTKIESPTVFKAKGDHYRRLGLLDKALNEYDKAISLKEDYPECYYWISFIYKKKGLYNQALYKINLAIKYKNSFFSKFDYYNTIFLKVQIHHSLILNKETNDSNNDDFKEIRNLLNNIISNLKQEENKISTENKTEYNYILGKAYFFKGFYLQENKYFKKHIEWFNKSIYYNYKKDFAYYYISVLYRKAYILRYQEYLKARNDKRNTINQIFQEALILRNKSIKYLKEARKLNPNILNDINQSEK